VHDTTIVSGRWPLIVLPGVALGDRLFAAQQDVFPQLQVPVWIEPLADETLADYARRMARIVDPGRPCIVGGASFGGAVALEMAPHLQSLACVLIGSFRDPHELPWQWRALHACGLSNPARLQFGASLLSRLPRRLLPLATRRSLARMATGNGHFERWAACAAMRWRPSPETRDLRVFQIHGDDDRILPVARSRADTIVPGGRHALTLFNSAAVNDYLQRVVLQVGTPVNHPPAENPA
jgi:pimeloyl-ACP methyl ester carboxylesterase